MPLIERSSSVLVVIDVQENFLNKLALHERSPLVSRIRCVDAGRDTFGYSDDCDRRGCVR